MITLGSLFDGIGGFPLAAIHNRIVPTFYENLRKKRRTKGCICTQIT